MFPVGSELLESAVRPNRWPNRWKLRDFVAATLLAAATGAFVLWQNAHVVILWDLGYMLDTSYRIALGQMPYRDFPLVHAPMSFLIQAAIIQLAGRLYLLPVCYAALVGGLGSVVTWRILLRLLGDTSSGAVAGAMFDRESGAAPVRSRAIWIISLGMASPLAFLGIYGVYPHPVYDSDCAFSILLALLLLQRLDWDGKAVHSFGNTWLAPLTAGSAAALPVFFKQNMGLPFLLAVGAGMMALMVANRSSPGSALPMKVLAGMLTTTLAGLALIEATAGLGNYLHWTVAFAAERRLPGLAPMLGVYQQPYFLWMLAVFLPGVAILSFPMNQRGRTPRRWPQIAAFCLLAAPFASCLVFLFLNQDPDDRADSLLALWPTLLVASAAVAVSALVRGLRQSHAPFSLLMPFLLLAAIHGTFLSQQLWGSSYAIWPLLILLMGYLLGWLWHRAPNLAPPLAAIAALSLLVCGALYSLSHERLNYIQLSDAPIEHATLPALRGMSTPGPYLPDFEDLVRFSASEIPMDDALLLLPGEGPFYFATGRRPRFPVLLFDRTTNPYSPEQLISEALREHVRWIIVKRRLQLTEDQLPDPTMPEVEALVEKQFALYRRLGGYDVYRLA